MSSSQSALVTRKDILDHFSKNLEWATRVDLPVALVTENKGNYKS